MSADVPSGELFSRVYLEAGAPAQDSVRFRRRVGNFLRTDASGAAIAVNVIATELGVRVPLAGNRYHWEKFTETADLRDLLDSVTLIYRAIKDSIFGLSEAETFRSFVARAFREENLGYRVDDEAGVHFYVDEEFERSRAAIIAGMGGARYQSALEAFEDAQDALSGANPDTLTAVRRVFDAVENVFKLMFGVARIGAAEIRSKLKPHLTSAFGGRSGDASKLLADSLAEWVNAGHQFRHAPGVPDPSAPPLGLALAMVGAGASYLRWLAELDSASN